MSGTLAEILRVFALLSLTAFGGGNVVIPEIQRQSVAVHGWLSAREFTEAFALSRAAPGPSTLFVLLVGWRAAGSAGAAAAVAAMFLPGAALMQAACAALARWGRLPLVGRAVAAFRPVTVGLVLASAAVMAKSTVVDAQTGSVALLAAAGATFTRAPMAALLLAAAAAGWLFC
jgi:chromate transporter